MKTDFKIKQFEKFYYFLMKEAPKDYIPWFFPCEPNGKDPCSDAIKKIDPSSYGSWHHEKARLNKEQVIEHIKQSYNIGISARKDDPLIIGDVDNPKYMNQTPKNTLTTRSRKRVVGHFFGWDKDGSAKINITTDDGEIRSDNQYVIAPGSYVPFNLKDKKDKKAYDELPDIAKKDELINYYTIDECLVPKEMTYNDFPQFFKDYDLEDIEEEAIIKNKNEKKEFSGEGKYSQLFNLKVADIIGLIPANKRVGHPLHESDTDANFSLSKDGSLGHCWRHLVSLNAWQYLCVKAKYNPCGKCGTPHKGRGISKIAGDKKAYEVAYNEAVKLGLIEEYKKGIKPLVQDLGSKIQMYLDGGYDRNISNVCEDISNQLENKNVLFYRPDSHQIVEIGMIKSKTKKEKRYTGFRTIKDKRFITLLEKFIVFGEQEKSKHGSFFSVRSLSPSKSSIILESQILEEALPQIERIFPVPLPIIYNEELTFPKKGFDERFSSWRPFDSPEIEDLEMDLKEAKEIIDKIYSEFCFKTDQDKTNAIAGLLTPFLRGIYTDFNTRVPIFFYLGNRERVGKDFCAGVTGIVYEGQAIEETPISSGDKKGNSNEELRKKITSNMIAGRRGMHFANNKGYINNAILEQVTTSMFWSDRLLGRNDVVTLPNEMDFSLSGNIGVTYTPDFANRSRFINLFLDIEDANSRKFENPLLHKWILENREKILSAIYSLVKNWFDNERPKGKIPFASFPNWADICGGIMECAGYDSPCTPDKESLSLAGDSETADMKLLFELCYEKSPISSLEKKEIVNFIEDEDIFSYINFDERKGQTNFGLKLRKFIGRVLSDIRLTIEDPSVRVSRQKYIFKKEKSQEVEEEEESPQEKEVGNVGNVGNVEPTAEVLEEENIYNRAKDTKDTKDTTLSFEDSGIKEDLENE